MSNKAVIEEYFDLANAERWDELGRLFCADARLTAVGARARIGRDDVMTYFARIFDQWPQHHDQPGVMIEEGNSIAVEITFVGRGHDGRQIEFDAVDVFHLRGGRIASMSSWYDSAYVGRFLNAGSGQADSGARR